MELSRQAAFQKLRPPCVELSSVALKFRSQQTTAKTVLKSAENVFGVLQSLGEQNALDEKLAEYAFFPLSTCFNDTRRLSSTCLEVCIRSLKILVARGWKQKLPAATGKQLLILLTWIAGGGPGQEQRPPASEELVTSSFECMDAIVQQLAQTKSGRDILNEIGTTTVVDQVMYLLLEAIDANAVESVQLAALAALRQIWTQISKRSILASLLPRTVSTLTKALRPTTKVRRSARTLVANLEVLTDAIRILLNDQAIIADQTMERQTSHTDSLSGETVLDQSWLNATASQIKLALAQIIQTRTSDRSDIKDALAGLCIMIVEECSSTLADCITLVTETLVVVCSNSEESNTQIVSTFRHVLTSHSKLADILKSSLYSWTTSLPRIMLGNDDRPKQRLLRQISFAFEVLFDIAETSEVLDDTFCNVLCESVTAAIQASNNPQKRITDTGNSPFQMVELDKAREWTSFGTVVISHHSQRESLSELQNLVKRLGESKASETLTRSIVQRVPYSSGESLISSIWLSLEFLKFTPRAEALMETFLDIPDSTNTSRPYMIEELYSVIVRYLDSEDPGSSDWRLTALSLEVLILQASQLGTSFRPELIDVLYPVLSLLGTDHVSLREHAMVTLDMLAKHLEYASPSAMLVDNVDYLINAISLKLNTFDLSPQGPQVMLMMLRLCGASIIPYLEDLIGSIFTALDTFHGYPNLMEVLFQVLEGIVHESSKSPQLAITADKAPNHRKRAYKPSTIDDILGDLRAHKRRRARNIDDTDSLQAHPKEPWSTTSARPQDTSRRDSDDEAGDLSEEDDSIPLTNDADKAPSLSKPHTLLLSIARSTIPHLASPSSMVQLTCLNMLTQVTPLLSRDENSFLPLVNDIWEAVVSRLMYSPENGATSEITFVRIAAMHTVSAVCAGAGDFMTTRIEELFPLLEKLYKSIWHAVHKERENQMERSRTGSKMPTLKSGSIDQSTMEIRIRESSEPPQEKLTLWPDKESEKTVRASRIDELVPVSSSKSLSGKVASASASSQKQPSLTINLSSSTTLNLHNALLELLSSILDHVRVSQSVGNRILQMTAPALFGGARMLQMQAKRADPVPSTTTRQDIMSRNLLIDALEGWNDDAVWLVRQHMQA